MTDAAPAAWNADARSRAQTRGLLMALSRNRASIRPRFTDRLPFTLVTFGLLPLIERARLFLSLERLEWSVLLEASKWIGSFAVEGEQAADLQERARFGLASARRRWIQHAVSWALVVVIYSAGLILMQSGRGEEAFVRSFELLRAGWKFALVCVAVWWFAQLVLILLHRRRLSGWLLGLNALLASNAKRSIDRLPKGWIVTGVLGIALVGLQTFIGWPIALLVIVLTKTVIAAHLHEVRRVHLQLIERILEWMDDSELPVEYDVVALNPDEIAAMMG